MNDSHLNFDGPDGPQAPEELLSAYLFDELEPAERLALEQRLAQEPELAAQLDALRGTLSLLRQASLDAGPGVLSEPRRAALRAEARDAQAAQAPGDGGAILAFPWLRAAAALLVVSAGVVLYTQPGLISPESNYEASGAAAGAGWKDDAPEETESAAALRLSQLGYADAQFAPADEEAPSGALDSTRGGRSDLSSVEARREAATRAVTDPTPEQQQLADRGRSVAEQPPLEELTELADIVAGLGGGAGGAFGERPSTEPEAGLFFDQAGRWEGQSKSQDLIANYSVPATGNEGTVLTVTPPAAGAPATPATPSIPGIPTLPSTPSTPASPTTPPPPGAKPVQPDASEAPRELMARARTQTATPELGVTGSFSGDTAELGRPIELGLLTTGYADKLGETDADGFFLGGEDFDLHFGRYAYVQDGYGRPYHHDQIIHHLRPIHENETPQDMFFRYYGDNAFVPAQQNAISTFAVDVDTASYPLARNYLSNQQLPPRASVRTEEVVNYFDQGLKAPEQDLFTVQLDAAPTPYGSQEGNLLMRVGVKAIEVEREERLPMNVVFVVDKSGSMRKENRLSLVQRSLELLLDQMRDDDKIGVVSFDTSGHVVQESVYGRDRWKVREALRSLSADGSTNAAEGLFLGYEMLDRNFLEGGINRVVLASDGVANTGETDQQRILEQVADFTARQVDLTTIGVGMGNHNDVFLEQLANKGNGSCHYVDGFEEAKRVFLDEFSSTMQTIARDVKIQVEFDEQRVASWRQIGYENRSLTAEQFRDDTVDAGEVGAGHEVVALYEVELAKSADVPSAGAEGEALATVRLRWKPDQAFTSALFSVQQKAGLVEELDPKLFETVEREWKLRPEQIVQDWDEAPSRYRLGGGGGGGGGEPLPAGGHGSPVRGVPASFLPRPRRQLRPPRGRSRPAGGGAARGRAGPRAA